MKKKSISIFGVTGSVGSSTLELLRQRKDEFEVVAITCNKNIELLLDLAEEFNPKAIAHKKLQPITKEQVHSAFNRDGLHVFIDSKELEKYLKALNWKDQNLLMMSSGNFDGINIANLIK